MANLYLTNFGSFWTTGNSIRSITNGESGEIFLAGGSGTREDMNLSVISYKDGIRRWKVEFGGPHRYEEFFSVTYKNGFIYAVGGIGKGFDPAQLGGQVYPSEAEKPFSPEAANEPEGDLNLAPILVKLDAETGDLVFARVISPSLAGNDSLSAVNVDNSGNIFISGRSGIQKFSSQGVLQWTVREGGGSIEIINEGAIFSQYGSLGFTKIDSIAGEYFSPIIPNFSGNELIRDYVTDQSGDIYCAIWVTDQGKGGEQALYALGLDPTVEVIIEKELEKLITTKIVKINGSTGEILWSVGLDEEGISFPSSITFDGNGNLVVSGSTIGDLNTNSANPESSFGTFDAYIATVTSEGVIEDIQIIGTQNSFEHANQGIIQGENDLYLAGEFSSNYYSLVNSGYQNIYLISDDGFTLMGDAQENIIQGGEGNDSINADSGNDTILGGSGNDSVDGGEGNDLIVGGNGAGNDSYYGGAGVDAVKYTSAIAAITVNLSTTTATARATNTRLADAAGIGSDKLFQIENVIAGDFNDTITGSSLANVFDGGLGNDTMDGGSGLDTADYANRSSNISVTLNTSTLVTVSIAGVVEDRIRNIENIIGGSGNDTITGDSLANVCKGGAGNDTLNGGAGIDTADYSDKTDSVLVVLTTSTAASVFVNSLAEDSIRNIENIIGGSGNDTLSGDSLTNTFRGGAGNDTLNGGSGVDIADYSDKTDAVRVTLSGATATTVYVNEVAEDSISNFENIVGGSGNDALTGESLANSLTGGDGNDTLRGAGGIDTLNGGAGIDTADFSDQTAAVVATLNGATQITVTIGGTSNDRLSNIENLIGGSGADTLTGDTFANKLSGGNGADWLSGGAGSDILNGGLGADRFSFTTTLNASSNLDTVEDFVSGTDKIGLRSTIFAKVSTSVGVANLVVNSSGNALDSNDYLIFNTSNSTLYYDADGSGAGAKIAFAVLTGVTLLTNTDFVIV